MNRDEEYTGKTVTSVDVEGRRKEDRSRGGWTV